MEASSTGGPNSGSIEAGPAGDRVIVDAPSRGLILLVDDEPAVARAYARTLGAAGFTVVTAGDGREAADAARDKSFDVIVSDIAMPTMDGIELLRTVREYDLDVPFVIMTGGPAVDSAARAMEYGALRYLVKPVTPEDLEAVVARAVRLHQMAKIKREALEMFRLEGKHLGDRASLEARLGRAMETLWVAYQPIVSWSRRSVFAYEALVRNEEPTLRSPPDLFEAAERLGRLQDLGRAVRDRVARTLDEQPMSALLFINLHAMELDDDSLISAAAPLSRHAARVVLEVTERAPLEKIRDVTARVARLGRDLDRHHRVAVGAVHGLGRGVDERRDAVPVGSEVLRRQRAEVGHHAVDGDVGPQRQVRQRLPVGVPGRHDDGGPALAILCERVRIGGDRQGRAQFGGAGQVGRLGLLRRARAHEERGGHDQG